MTDRAYWTLYADSRGGPRHFVAGVYATREAALDAAQRLWKHGAHPTRLVAPNGETVEMGEIDRYGREHPEAAD